jgi:hypothetical protein
MKQIVKKFNNLIKKTILKLQNKTTLFKLQHKKNNKFIISSFNKYLITFFGLLFFYLFYLLIPLLYGKGWIQSNIESKFINEFKIELSSSADISYRILPAPHFLIKNSKILLNGSKNQKSIADIKNLKVFISQNNLFNKDNIRINEVIIEKANFSLLNDNFRKLYENSDDKFSEKKIKVNNSNIFFKDNLNEVISIIKISNAFLFFDKKNLFNLFDLNGEVFNIPFELNYQNTINSQKNIKIKAPDLKLKIINKFFKEDEDLNSGMNNISILNSSIKTKYSIKDQIVIFQSDSSKVFNPKINYNGQLTINPFDLNLKINLDDYKSSNLFAPNSIINEFIKSGLLFNENISVNTLVNIKSIKKDAIFNEAKIELKILNGKISFDKSVFINNNVGLMEVSNSDLFLENNKLILTADLEFDIQNIDRLYSFLNTNKRLRKDIKNIKLNIIYDLLSNEIVFKNIKVDDNEVSDQFMNIVEGFIDNNSNNLIKSRRLLNELINLYVVG